MTFAPRMMILSTLVIGCALTGCQSPKLASVQSQLRDTVQVNRELQKALANQKTHGNDLAKRLELAENELDSLDAHRNADQRKLANYKNERRRLGQLTSIRTGGGAMADRDQQLAQLAKQFPGLRYDPQLGIAKLETDILYSTGSAELRPESKRILAELVGIVEAPETKDYKIMLAGHTDDRLIKGRDVRSKYPTNWHLSSARAQNALNFLLHRGLAKERFALTSYGMQQPVVANTSDESRQLNRRVEIFLLPVDARVASWPETIPSIYR